MALHFVFRLWCLAALLALLPTLSWAVWPLFPTETTGSQPVLVTGTVNSGTGGTVMNDTDEGDLTTKNIIVGSTLENLTDAQSCTVTVVAAGSLTCDGLTGGGTFTPGDSYRVLYPPQISTADWNAARAAPLTTVPDLATLETALGSINVIASTEIDTSAEIASLLGDETGTGLAVFGTSPIINTPNLRGAINYVGTAVDDDDCTGQQGQAWWDSTDNAFEWCNANSGLPAVLGAGGGSGDIESVLGGTTGAVDQLHQAATAFGTTDATPNVVTSGKTVYKTADTTVLTDFDDGTDHTTIPDGLILLIFFQHAAGFDCTASAITCNAGTDWTAQAGDRAWCTFDANAGDTTDADRPWHCEVSRPTAVVELTRGGLQIDVSEFEGLVRISSSMTTDVGSLTALNTTLGTSIANANDTAYNASTWDANADTPTKNAVRDKFETMMSVSATQCIHVTVVAPNDLADSVRDQFRVWQNLASTSFTVTSWTGQAGTDNTTLNIEQTTSTGASNATVDAVEIATDGTVIFTGTDIDGITAGTIAAGNILWLDFDDNDLPTWVSLSICGNY